MSLGEKDAGISSHSNKFLKRLASDILHLFPKASSAESEICSLYYNLLREWRMLNHSGSFCRLLDSSWGVESLLSIFNTSFTNIHATLINSPALPWCSSHEAVPNAEISTQPSSTPLAILPPCEDLEDAPPDHSSQIFETPKIQELEVSVAPTRPADFRRYCISHPTSWHAARRPRRREARRMKRMLANEMASAPQKPTQ